MSRRVLARGCCPRTSASRQEGWARRARARSLEVGVTVGLGSPSGPLVRHAEDVAEGEVPTGAVDGSDVEECERRGRGEVADDVVPVGYPSAKISSRRRLISARSSSSGRFIQRRRWPIGCPHHRFDLRSWSPYPTRSAVRCVPCRGGRAAAAPPARQRRRRRAAADAQRNASSRTAHCSARRRSSWPTPLVIRLPVEPCSGGSPRSRRRVEQESHAAVPPRPSAVVVLLPWSVGRARTVGVSRAAHPQEAAERTMGDACGARAATGTGPTKRPPRPRSRGDGRDPPCRGIGACVGSTQAVRAHLPPVVFEPAPHPEHVLTSAACRGDLGSSRGAPSVLARQ